MQKWEMEHKEHRDAYHKKYIEANRDRINKRNREKLICRCGCVVSRSTLRTHLKRKKHAKQLEMLRTAGFKFEDE